ncbi:CBU_0592 family membrane protein [Sphingobium sp. Z007]|uniref:CBU_0592 family membrane protein n=1 Tax=Sphingobium sp. Z007 TaxID=627495 RepID=UPI000B49E1F3|nr:hypothetical protein [Sphingobium sp. Z007]
MMAVAIEIIGWIGALLVLAAYVGVSTGRMSGESATFQWLNALGAALFVLNTWWHGAFPSMVLNIIWSVVGFATLWRIMRRRMSRS